MNSGGRSSKRKSGLAGSVTQLQLPLLSDALKDCEILRAELTQLRQENAALRAEILQLKSAPGAMQVAEPKTAYSPSKPVSKAQDDGTSRTKLFLSLFRARDDVYAQRWQKQDGTTNYSPAKSHDWNSHTRTERGKLQCGPNCQLMPLTEKVLQDHFNGTKTIGIYPLLKDETCWLLAVDFDDADWSNDALAFLETCDAQGVPAYLERSRSGTGGHVWIFFDNPVRASQARALGAFLISETKQGRYQLDFNSYDRMFPNQDTMPRGGYGNLIALPLQLEPSKVGNSVFVDRDLHPFEDQWAYLGSIVRLRVADLESIVRAASAREAIFTVPLSSDDPDSEEPWKKRKPQDKKLKPPHPAELQVVKSNMIYVRKDGFSSSALSKVMAIAAFQNPEFYQKQATRQSTHDTPRVICCAENLERYIALS